MKILGDKGGGFSCIDIRLLVCYVGEVWGLFDIGSRRKHENLLTISSDPFVIRIMIHGYHVFVHKYIIYCRCLIGAGD